MNRIWAISAVVLSLFFGDMNACAQIQLLSKEKRESVNNPQLAAGSESLVFDAVIIEAGELDQEQTPDFVFSFTNRSDKAILITRVTTTCSCAVPSWEKVAVQPGGVGSIGIKYLPKGHPGKFDRRVFVYTNLSSSEPSAILRLKGSVKQSENDKYTYYVVEKSFLRFKTDRFHLIAGRAETLSIQVLNNSANDYTPRCNKDFLAKCLGFQAETIAPGEIGEITISYDGSPVPNGELKIFLEGLNISPRDSAITIEIEK